MTKRDFFILIIKLFGLYSIITSIFSVLSGNITFALTNFDVFGIIWIILALVIVLGLFVILIFKAENIVKMQVDPSLLRVKRKEKMNRIYEFFHPAD